MWGGSSEEDRALCSKVKAEQVRVGVGGCCTVRSKLNKLERISGQGG